jgi:hypothetical protein
MLNKTEIAGRDDLLLLFIHYFSTMVHYFFASRVQIAAQHSSFVVLVCGCG